MEWLGKLKSGYLFLLLLPIQGAVLGVSMGLSFIPSWEMPVKVAYLIPYVFCLIICFLLLRNLNKWLDGKVKRLWRYLGVSMWTVFAFGYLGCSFVATLILETSDILEEYTYCRTVELKESGAVIYLYNERFLINEPGIYIRRGRWPLKKKIVRLGICRAEDVIVTEHESVIRFVACKDTMEYDLRKGK